MKELDPGRLGRLARSRRKQVGFKTAAQLAAAAQVSVRLISDLENGRRTNFTEAIKASVEEKLLWDVGSINRTLAGGDPVELGGACEPAGVAGQESGGAAVSVFENLTRFALMLELQKADRRALNELLKTAKLKEETLAPLASNPEVAQLLNKLYRDSVAEVRRIVERSVIGGGK